MLRLDEKYEEVFGVFQNVNPEIKIVIKVSRLLNQ